MDLLCTKDELLMSIIVCIPERDRFDHRFSPGVLCMPDHLIAGSVPFEKPAGRSPSITSNADLRCAVFVDIRYPVSVYCGRAIIRPDRYCIPILDSYIPTQRPGSCGERTIILVVCYNLSFLVVINVTAPDHRAFTARSIRTCPECLSDEMVDLPAECIDMPLACPHVRCV